MGCHCYNNYIFCMYDKVISNNYIKVHPKMYCRFNLVLFLQFYQITLNLTTIMNIIHIINYLYTTYISQCRTIYSLHVCESIQLGLGFIRRYIDLQKIIMMVFYNIIITIYSILVKYLFSPLKKYNTKTHVRLSRQRVMYTYPLPTRS